MTIPRELRLSTRVVFVIVVTLLSNVLATVAQQYQQQPVRVAPGVPPQQYVPPPHHAQQPPHHVQQPPQHHQQQQHHVPPGGVPIQHVQHQQQQHVPVQQLQNVGHQPQHQQQVVQHHQQQQQQQQHHQVPGLQPQHGHAHAHEQARLLDASNVLQERSHIQEHMDVPIDTSQMTEQELQFHYFKMHDADNNNKLDGCELVKSLIHWHDSANHNPNAGHAIPEQKIFKDEELIQMIDPILQNDDLNRDGTIDYAEFSRAQANAAARAATGAQ